VGSPDDVARTVKRYQDIGLDMLVLIPAAGWVLPHERTVDSLHLMGKSVLPLFR
jgi:hypothetical protein